jgi:hypothetical protein
MVERFGIAHKKSDIGFYLGLITTAFLASQSLTNPLWGWISDRIGRKPVVLIGTFGTMIGFLLFGFSETYAWVFPVCAMLTEGNCITGPGRDIECKLKHYQHDLRGTVKLFESKHCILLDTNILGVGSCNWTRYWG